MLLEINNKAIRKKTNTTNNDKQYLQNYYAQFKTFPLFSQVLIETRTDCNKRCSFCPQSFYKRTVESIKWSVYKKIIDSLAEIGFAGRIALLVSNEPLLEHRLLKMIKYAKKKSPRFFLDITTNGVLLSMEKLDELFSAGLDNININDYRNDRETEPDKISENLIEIVEKFRSNPKVSYNARSANEVLPNYAGVIPQDYDAQDYGFCNFPFRKLVFSVNGDVLLCCNDFKQETNFGSIITDSILSIWNSPKLNAFRLSLLDDKRIGLCKKCNDKQTYSIF
jgi:radical SAM protein with 4Fe4S-binding SPASM domain